MARITYKVHDITIPQANDPTKTISKTVYQSEDHHSEAGMIGFDAQDATLVSNVLTPVDSVVVVRGEGASADVIDHIIFGSIPDINDKDLLWLIKGAEAITINHNTDSPPANSGPILLLSQANKKMIGSRMVLLQRQGSNFQEIAFDGIVGNGGILVEDDNGNAIIVCGSVASAVNHLKVTNAATGNDVIVEAIGTDTDIGIILTPKGAGRLTLLEQVVNNIRESTGKAIAIAITAIASAVNYIEVKANIAANDPEIQAKGSDTDVGIKFVPKGAGVFTIAGNVINEKRHQLDKGADLPSPAGGILTLGGDGNVFDITGTNTINEILGTGWQAGSVIHLQFDGVLTVTHNSGGTNDILLSGDANFVTAARNVLTIHFDGTDWIEDSRSVLGGGGADSETVSDFLASTFTTTSATLVDTGLSLTLPNISGGNFWGQFSATVQSTVVSADMGFSLDDAGTKINEGLLEQNDTAASLMFMALHGVGNADGGTLKVQAKTSAGTLTLFVTSGAQVRLDVLGVH